MSTMSLCTQGVYNRTPGLVSLGFSNRRAETRWLIKNRNLFHTVLKAWAFKIMIPGDW